MYYKMKGLNMKKINFSSKTKGFTLAETLITLTILGVIAAITVPMLINKQMEAANRTKLKKAMAAYEKALNQMIVDNDVKNDIASALNTAGCTITSPYFKKINGDGCHFQTADKVWWDITDIEHPLISLKDEITDDNIATLKSNADSLDDDKTSFVMVGEIKDGIVRINDKGGIVKDSDDEKYVDKLYVFTNKESNNQENISERIAECNGDVICKANIYKETTCPSGTLAGATGEWKCTNCGPKGCIAFEGEMYSIYDENGDHFISFYNAAPDDCWDAHFNKVSCPSNSN